MEKVGKQCCKVIVFYQGGYYSNGATAADRRVRDLARGLVYAGAEVELHLPAWKKNQKDLPTSDLEEYSLVYLGSKESKGKVRKRINYWKQFLKYFKENKVDAVLFYGATPDLIFPSYIIKNRFKKISIAEFCDSHALGKHKFLKKLSIIAGEQILPKCTNLNIAISDYLEQQVKKAAPKVPTLKIPILVDSDAFKARDSKKSDQFKITYIGGLWKDYGVGVLLEAFSDLLKNHKQENFQLTIAGRLGNTEKHTDVRGKVKQLGIENNTDITGWVSTSRVIELLNEADVVVIPHLDTPFCNAGLPTKLAEYAIMAKAVVMTDVGDVGQFFTDKENGLICNPNNAESMFKCLEELYKSPSLLNKVGNAAQKLAFSLFDYKVNGGMLLKKIKEHDTGN